ncbi:MAG TPA: bifunctional phosphoribosylaminoimidazolecarboxamide formyltransferase/IMP cyclohydrolase, partial [Dermatophilaceae bacterium]
MSESNASGKRVVRRALISVYDKAGLEVLAKGLHEAGVALVSTGSTAARIADAGVPVMRVEDLTGFPEVLDGRVKTLHPTIHAGILADTGNPDHVAQLTDLGIEPFDLVVSNLYPFSETVGSGATQEDCIEQIDIGGPSMMRAAAKNHASVAIVTNPAEYGSVLVAVRGGGFTLNQRKTLASEAFVHTASYDIAVASWMGSVLADSSDGTGFPAWVGATWTRARVLRYGENPHQKAALYAHWRPGIATAEQLHGKEMSYNNFIDADAAQRAAYDHSEPAVAIIKHANPCGIAIGADIAEAYGNAHACDPQSAFGGVIATNRPVTVAMAEQVAEVFTEVVVAPAYEPGALEILQRKKAIRLLKLPEGLGHGDQVDFRAVSGGVLMQTRDKVDAVVEG